MILLKDEILQNAKDPNVQLLGNEFDEKSLQGSSYDLRVGAVFKGQEIISEHHNENANWDIAIKPSEIVTVLTLEEVNLPDDICGTVFPINSWSSTGLLILNPGHIDPGYKGPITICAINLSKETKYLQVRKTRIFTMIFNRLPKHAEPYRKNSDFLKLRRREKEQDHFITKARKLSTSVFDLIKENEYEPFLKKLVEDSIRQQFYKAIARIVGWIVILATVLGTLYAVLSYYNSDDKEGQKIESLQRKISEQDSIIKSLQQNSIR